MIVPRSCPRCHVVVSERQRCPCIVCRACTTDGGAAGPHCACTRAVEDAEANGEVVCEDAGADLVRVVEHEGEVDVLDPTVELTITPVPRRRGLTATREQWSAGDAD